MAMDISQCDLVYRFSPIAIIKNLKRTWKQFYFVGLIFSLLIQTSTSGTTPIFENLDMQTFQSSQQSISYYNVMHLDTNRKVLYVGGADYMYQLVLDGSSSRTLIPSVRLPASQRSYETCTFRQNEDVKCKNHIRMIEPLNGKILLCGTNAGEPSKIWLHQDLTVNYTDTRNSGKLMCPFWPETNVSTTYVTDTASLDNSGSPVFGALPVKDTSGMSFVRPAQGSNQQLISKPDDIRYVQEGTPAGTFGVGNYVYFWFREISPEYQDIDLKMTVSRIGRVCKNDKGNDITRLTRITYVWATFQKVRIICQQKKTQGSVSYQYNELYDVIKVSDTKFYALFNTNDLNGKYATAVCAFTQEEIDQAFEGNFKNKKDQTSLWESFPREDDIPYKCETNTRELENEKAYQTTQRTIMYEDKISEPLFYTEIDDIQFNKLAYEQVQGKNAKMYTVFFLASNRGTIYKVSHWMEGSESKSHVLSILKPFGDEIVAVNQLKSYENKLYITSDEKVMEISAQQCNSYKYCTDCIRDPYCGWDQVIGSCQNIHVAGEVKSDHLQNIEGKDSGDECQCQRDAGIMNVRVPGDPVYLKCDSICSHDDTVTWKWDDQKISIDYKKYVLSTRNELIILNVTTSDTGVYTCHNSQNTLVRYQLNTPKCNEPDCLWEEEFKTWCSAFDQYQQEFDHWRCLKNDAGECSTPSLP